MNVRPPRAFLAVCVLGLVVAGCQEQLTAPGTCPATCPGGTPEVRDTVIDATVGGDTTFAGFVIRGGRQSGLLVSNGLHGDTDLALVRFLARDSGLTVRDTLRTFTIDSVLLTVTMQVRDTLVSGTELYLYRAPATVDSGTTYAEASALLTPGNLIDSVTIPDSITTLHTFTWMFTGADLAKVDIPAPDDRTLAMVVAIGGPTQTGLRIGGIASGGATPSFNTFVTLNVPDTTTSIKHQVIVISPAMATYLTSAPHPVDPDLLTLGSAFGTRALVRFKFPAYLKDSALISRATLELVPAAPITGLTGDSVNIDAYGILADFGAKSPLYAGTHIAGFSPLLFGSSDTLRIDVVTEVKNWQNPVLAHPPALVLQTNQEGASFAEPTFFSTRSPSGHPRLHITYQLPFPFERP